MCLNGAVVNPICHSVQGGSLEFTSIVSFPSDPSNVLLKTYNFKVVSENFVKRTTNLET